MEPNNIPALTSNGPANQLSVSTDPNTVSDPTSIKLAPASAAPTIVSVPPNAKALWGASRRRWGNAVGLGLLVGAVVAVVGYFLTSPTSYTAVSLLKVESTTPQILFAPTEGRMSFEMYQRSLVERAKSRMVLNAALREPKVAQLAVVKEQPDPIEWLEKLVQVDFALSPEEMRFSVTLNDSEAALAIVDALRMVFLGENVNADKKQRLDHLTTLEKLYSDCEEQLKSKRASLKKLTDDIGSNDPKFLANKQELALKELNMIQQQQLNLKMEILRAKVEANDRKQKAQAMEAAPVPEDTIEAALQKDPLILVYQNEIAKLEGSLALGRQREKNPEQEAAYVHDQKALSEAQKGLEARRSDQIPKITAHLRDQLRRKLLREQADEEDQVAKLSEFESLLGKRADERDEFVRGFTKKARSDLSGLNEEIERIGAIAKKLGDAVVTLKIESNAWARVTPMDESYVTKHEGMGLKIGAVAGLVGFCAVLASFALLEFLFLRAPRSR